MLSDGSTHSPNNNKDALVDGMEHDDDIQKSVSPDIHSSSSGAQTRKQGDKTENKDKGKSLVITITGFRDLNAEFKECNNNRSNEVNAASSSVSTAGKNSINNTNDFSAAGPSNVAMPNLEDLSHSNDADDVGVEADINNLESIILVSPIPTTKIHKDHLTSQIIGDLSLTTQTRSMARAVRDQVDLPYGKRAIGTKWVYRNKKDERGIVIRNKSRLVAQGHTHEEGIDYENGFALVARSEAIRLFLAYASFMGFLVYQMDVKSAFLYGTIEEEVYVCQPPGFEDPENPIKVKQKKEGIFISQDKYVAEILKKFRLSEGKSASTPIDAEKPLLKDSNGEDVDVHTYRLIFWQCKKQTVVATSLKEAECVAAASGCAQVLWIQNQLLDYGYNFMHTFYNTASIKRSGDVTRLQALVDKKKIMISEVVIHEILQLDDAKGIVCLPNEEIFAGLAQMGYEKPSTKQTFYKAFFSSQWKFLIHTILQSLSAKRTSWNEFSTAMASAVICLSKGQKFNFSKYIFDSLVRNVDSSSTFYMYPRFIQLIIQNQVGDLSTHTTRFISPTLTQKLRRLRKVGASRRIESSDDMEDVFNHERMIDDIDKDEGIDAVSAIIPAAKPSIPTATLTVVAAYTRRRKGVIIRDQKEELSSKTPAEAPAETPKVKDKGKGILVKTSKPMKKKDQIELDAEYVRKLHEEINRDHEGFNKDIDWDAAMDHVNQKSNNPRYIKRYQGIKKRPQTESESHKNMMIYLKNTIRT
nr:copia protein [Tanacetum cinerariifolium]